MEDLFIFFSSILFIKGIQRDITAKLQRVISLNIFYAKQVYTSSEKTKKTQLL